MHRSHVAITEWFWAAYLVATHTPGISALQLQRQLGITSNDTTWYMLQRLRKGMVNEKRTPLTGLIEDDVLSSVVPQRDNAEEAQSMRITKLW